MERQEKLQKVIRTVQGYYAQPNSIIDWNEWVFEDHVKIVDRWVVEIAKAYSFDVEKTRIAAYLHDIAYAWTSKSDPALDEQSYIKAREILTEIGFDAKDIAFIVDEVISKHSANDGPIQGPMEARVLAAADALAHLTTDFYIVMCWKRYLFEDKSLSDYKAWVLKKIARDFNNKITFEDLKEKTRPQYEALVSVFGANAQSGLDAVL